MLKHLLLFLLLVAQNNFAQHRADMRTTNYRLLCVVPMVGAGTAADPHRPEYAPLPPAPGAKPASSGIIAFAYQLSDDGQLALVEFVARNRSAFDSILADKRPNVKAFEVGKAKRADIEAEFRKHKKNFDLDKLRVSVP